MLILVLAVVVTIGITAALSVNVRIEIGVGRGGATAATGAARNIARLRSRKCIDRRRRRNLRSLSCRSRHDGDTN